MQEEPVVQLEVKTDPDDPLTALENLVRTFESFVAPFVELPGLAAEDKERFTGMIGLLKLACFYFKETTACFRAEAFFAANVTGAAALETILLLMCLANEKDVRMTRTWQGVLKGKAKPLLKVLGNADLEKLVEIANELEWFTSTDIPERFREHFLQHFGPEISRTFAELVPKMSGHQAAHISRDARNKLHPAKMFRKPFELSNTDGMIGSVFLLYAFCSVVEKYSRRAAAATAG